MIRNKDDFLHFDYSEDCVEYLKSQVIYCINRFMIKNNFSEDKLAHFLMIRKETLKKYLSGEKLPHVLILIRLSMLFDMGIEDLLFSAKDPKFDRDVLDYKETHNVEVIET